MQDTYKDNFVAYYCKNWPNFQKDNECVKTKPNNSFRPLKIRVRPEIDTVGPKIDNQKSEVTNKTRIYKREPKMTIGL